MGQAKKPPLVPGDGDSRHGTRSGYSRWKCRCDECKAAESVYQTARYAYSGNPYPSAGTVEIIRPYMRGKKRYKAPMQNAKRVQAVVNLTKSITDRTE